MGTFAIFSNTISIWLHSNLGLCFGNPVNDLLGNALPSAFIPVFVQGLSNNSALLKYFPFRSIRQM
jgi:hypothetical protein